MNPQVLVVEDELTNAILLKRVLGKAGYDVTVANNGLDALGLIDSHSFDAILTDWMMPRMDGIELIQTIRNRGGKSPLIIMITALVSENARSYSLESGADDYIAKPLDIDELLTRLQDALERRLQKMPGVSLKSIVKREISTNPPFVGVCIATSTGGPPALIEILKKLPKNLNAAYFIVQHGPAWMLETFSNRLELETGHKINIAYSGKVPDRGEIYIAPGDKHMKIDSKTFEIILDDGPKENYVRPSADQLFSSVANAFGKYSVGVVLTGLGRDAAKGAAQISSVKGTLIVQDPATALAPSMPETVIESGIESLKEALPTIYKTLTEKINNLSSKLQ